ncbi:MAG: hypothetical protein IKH95_01980 [Bacteroidaceae bacterium]|nr:hypothetical protein [Bacteroidaceae bacterium]
MEYNNKIPGKKGQITDQGYTHERDRWEPEPFINRPRWSAMKIVVVTLILLALCYGVNYLMKEMSGPEKQEVPASQPAPVQKEDATTEEDLSLDMDEVLAPDLKPDQTPEEAQKNTEEDLRLNIIS